MKLHKKCHELPCRSSVNQLHDLKGKQSSFFRHLQAISAFMVPREHHIRDIIEFQSEQSGLSSLTEYSIFALLPWISLFLKLPAVIS